MNISLSNAYFTFLSGSSAADTSFRFAKTRGQGMYTVNKSTQSEHQTVVVFVVFLKAALKLKHVFFNLSIFRYYYILCTI